MKILVVDDNNINVLLLTKFLKKIGYESSSVSDGLEVLEVLKETHFEVIFMDVCMPNLDGLETTKIIRKSLNMRQPFIVGCTASVDSKSCLRSGMDYFIGKPITKDEVQYSLDFAQRQAINKLG